MSQVSRNEKFPIPFSNDDIMLIYKTEIMTPLMKSEDLLRKQGDISKKCNECNEILSKMISDKLGNVAHLHGKPYSAKYLCKKGSKILFGDNKFSSPQDQLNQLFKLQRYFTNSEDNKREQRIIKSDIYKQMSCLTTKSNCKRSNTLNYILPERRNKQQFSLNFSSNNQQETTKRINDFLGKRSKCLSSKSKKEAEKMYSEQANRNPIKLTKTSRIFSPLPKQSKTTYMNYVESKNKRETEEDIYSKEHHCSENGDAQYNSITNSVIPSHNRNHSALFNITLSTHYGLHSPNNHFKFKTINTIAKLRDSLNEASRQLVPKLCKMKKRRFRSEPIQYYKSFDEQDKEFDLETLLDIKVGKRNRKAISKALNNNVSNKKSVEYRKAVVKFANQIGRVNPETAFVLADTIRDGYFEKTNTGKFKEPNMSHKFHESKMRSFKIKMTKNHDKLATLLINIGKVKK